MNGSIYSDDYIGKVIDKYSDMLMRITLLHMKSKSEAEDIAQDVFIKLFEKQKKFESDEHEKAWLIRVAINLCKDRLKTAWIRKTVKLDETNFGSTPQYKLIILLAGSLATILVVISIFIKLQFWLPNEGYRSTENVYGAIRSGGASSRVCDMQLSGDRLFYTDHEGKLYCFDNFLNNRKLISNIEIAPGSSFYEEHGYIYYGNGTSIFKRSLKDNISIKLITGKNIWVDAVNNGRLFYHIAYKDHINGGFKEFETHMYDILTGNDIVLFNRSEDMWSILAIDRNMIVADASSKNDSGLFLIDLSTEISKKKLSNLRAHDGILINGIFYYTSQEEKGLWAVQLSGGKQHKIPVPGLNEDNFFVDRITGFLNNLYIAVFFNGNNHIISLDLKTYDATILSDGFGRVWKICTNGKALYVYDTKSAADTEGQITFIDIK